MGEVVEMILEGIVCQVCGETMPYILDGEDPCGFPVTCCNCREEGEHHVH